MASEPTEEAIASFISFTSSSRDQAIGLLKANNLDSNKAINAYFEGPTIPPQTEAPNPPSDQNVPSFKIEQSDQVPGTSLVAPPSRPPSRISQKESARPTEYQGAVENPAQGSTDNDQKLSLAEREEHELQQAVAMSLNQNLGQQETGVTSTNQPNFGPATRDFYDDGNWSMTLFNPTSREVVVSPDPEDRKRVDNEPAFLRTSPDNPYLGGLLTILHCIPLAREALLLRNNLLSNYGHDSQWWNGQPINLPKIVTVHDGIHGDNDWDDILHETQRLVAFLDSTTRAFGSSDALAGLRSLVSLGSEGKVGKYLEKWQEAAIRADPGNQLATIFSSTASKRPLAEYDEPIKREFTALDPLVEPSHGQTLYDVLDFLMWADKPGEELDDVWLEDISEVLTIKLEAQESSKSVDVKIPSVFYPDRYLASCRELARDFRNRKLQLYEEISRIEMLMDRFTFSKSNSNAGLTSREILEKAADAVPVLLRNAQFTPEAANLNAERLENRLREMSNKIEEKLKELEHRRSSVIETLRNHSKLFTEPSQSPSEPPCHKYTLRGVCTEPHVTYILRRCSDKPRPDDEWQWWRISFSTDDARTRQAEKSANQPNERGTAAPKNADVIGYTARKVREIEVLRAAREEAKSALLVYASDNAVNFQGGSTPPPLQAFVDMDNMSLEEECQEAANATPSAKNQDAGWESFSNENWNDQTTYAPSGSSHYPNTTSHDSAKQGVNVFDYEVTSFDDEKPAQEMQEKGGHSLLSQNMGQQSSSMDMEWDNADDSGGTADYASKE